MPKGVGFMTFLLSCLDGSFSKDLISWHNNHERILDISFRHGNSRKGRSQQEAAQVWLAWDRLKNRVPDFSKMTNVEINSHLTNVRQRFRQALKVQVRGGFLKPLKTGDKRIERYQIASEEEKEIFRTTRKSKRKYSVSSSSGPDSPTMSDLSSSCNSSASEDQLVPCVANPKSSVQNIMIVPCNTDILNVSVVFFLNQETGDLYPFVPVTTAQTHPGPTVAVCEEQTISTANAAESSPIVQSDDFDLDSLGDLENASLEMNDVEFDFDTIIPLCAQFDGDLNSGLQELSSECVKNTFRDQ